MSMNIPTEDAHERVIELYQANVTLDQITEQTGVPRSTIYYILDKNGVEPNRRRPAARSATLDEADAALVEFLAAQPAADPEMFSRIVDVNVQLYREVGRLEAQRDYHRQIARSLYKRLERAVREHPELRDSLTGGLEERLLS